MNKNTFQRVRFKRGPDRRSGSGDTQNDLRQSEKDRRKTGPNWLTLFKGTDDDLIMESIGDCDVLIMPAGSTLLKPGDKNDCIYLLLSGKMAAHLDSSLNPDNALPIMPGECIGEFSAVDGKPVSALVLVCKDARVLQIPPDFIWSRLMPIPGVAKNLLVSLTERMRRSNEVTAEAIRKQIALEYLKHELEIARQLQASMLPLHQPLFPDRNDLEIAGLMEPASEIGGDLFDAFFVDENLLFFSIGDVSGHGIPAALFMARTIGLMHISAMGTNRPDHVLERINNQLCEGNQTNMFVTLLCGFLDVITGRLIYSNAGHCAPLVLKNGEISRLTLPKGMLAGVVPNNHYQAFEVFLAEGETLICFTDGVTEAQTPDGQEFSEPRLLDVSLLNATASLPELLNNILKEVIAFTGNKVFGDDCTMLALRRSRN
jgi:phosphoserine phosphatase RsbU/P